MLKKLLANTFLKVFSYNGVVVFGKIIASFIVSKVSAIYLGPSGYALVGNLKNLLQGVLGITANGFESGIIKYVAEHKTNNHKLKQVVSAVIFLSFILSLIIGLFLVLFSKSLSIFLLKDITYAYVFRLLAVLLPLISFNFLIIYIANGLQKLRLYTSLITVANLLNAILTFFLVFYFNLKGALIASIIVPALSFLIGLWFKDVRRLVSGLFVNVRQVSLVFIKSISVYIAMATYSTVLISVTYLLIRNKIIVDIDTNSAGLWEAMNKISTFYMMFFSSLFTLYLLPQLAINKTVSGYKNIMKTYFKYLIPITIFVFVGLLIFRLFIIKIFLTDSFAAIEQYFYLQLIGDFFKIIAFSLAYQFHAKKMVTFYFITDAILYLSFYFMSLQFLNHFNLQGVFYAYIISTLLYLISVSFFLFFNNAKYLEENV
ncbi:O-antigen translocase [Hwangdonia lutea]|uniref:O-antigen translocase n=1 Tax=Hwangdonia lutea TaxID=3075823 RepID=A0AA97HPR1_9FLAO|nr:O-antigen translocase [Hwangdonia sp. SCSIO 19198]WOD42902.1 O-antigen translocase [Hwangdonia sp. SCSIO 19198]